MAYTYTPYTVANTGLVIGDVIRYGNTAEFEVTAAVSGGGWYDTTSHIQWCATHNVLRLLNFDPLFAEGWDTSMPDSVVYLRSGTASTTLTDKTKSFAVGVMAAINAIITKVNSLTGRVTAVETLAASKAAIDDTTLASTTTTLSASKIVALNATVLSDANSFATNAANEAKAAAISQLAGVDGTQLQALNDLQAALQANADADGVIASDLLNKVDYSKSQTLTDAQAAQARANIKFDSAVTAALLVTVGDVSLFDPDAILATALALD